MLKLFIIELNKDRHLQTDGGLCYMIIYHYIEECLLHFLNIALWRLLERISVKKIPIKAMPIPIIAITNTTLKSGTIIKFISQNSEKFEQTHIKIHVNTIQLSIPKPILYT